MPGLDVVEDDLFAPVEARAWEYTRHQRTFTKVQGVSLIPPQRPNVNVPIIIGILVALSGLGRADETAIDLYGGLASPWHTDAEARAEDATTVEELKAETNPRDGYALGLRVGRWFAVHERIHFGPFVDVSFSQFSFGDTRLTVLPIALLPMVRVALHADGEYPHGRAHVYAGLGPAYFRAGAENDKGLEANFGDEDSTIGLDARLGVSVAVTPTIAFFVEWRLTYVEYEFDDVEGVPGDPFRLELELDALTNHVLIGVGFRF